MYSLVSLLSGIYPLPAIHSLLVTLYVTEYLIGINQRIKELLTFLGEVTKAILRRRERE